MKLAAPLMSALIASASTAYAETIAVSSENFAQAETAWNFTNWARKGADQGIVHLREVTPVGPEAPTVRMNWDTLYSIQIVKVSDDGVFSVTLPESDLYVSVQVMDEDGFSPHFVVEPGHHDLSVSTDYAFLIFRTELKDRTDASSLVHLHEVQDQIQVTGFLEDSTYTPPEFDQAQLEALRARYKAELQSSGTDFTYAKGPGQVDQHILDLSHAAGWGGYPPELGVSNVYQNSPLLDGETCLAVTFEDPENRFFTSFTLYDETGYLIEGNSHINSNMWKPNADGTIRLHFNCDGDVTNPLSSSGASFNYSIRNYGVSQTVLDGDFRPVKPDILTD